MSRSSMKQSYLWRLINMVIFGAIEFRLAVKIGLWITYDTKEKLYGGEAGLIKLLISNMLHVQRGNLLK